MPMKLAKYLQLVYSHQHYYFPPASSREVYGMPRPVFMIPNS